MSQQTTAATSPPALDPQLKRIAAAVITGAIAVILDTTIVSVAIHELGNSLDASVSTIQWVSTAYLLAMFVAIPFSGWAQSRLGAKRLWLLALTLFLLGSVLCAFAWNVDSLIVFRVVQGLGGGVMMPLMTTILMQAAHGQNVGRLMAAVSLPAALGPILGPVHRWRDPELPVLGVALPRQRPAVPGRAVPGRARCFRRTTQRSAGCHWTWSACC